MDGDDIGRARGGEGVGEREEQPVALRGGDEQNEEAEEAHGVVLCV